MTRRFGSPDRPVFVVRLVPKPGVDPIHAMRDLLKIARRRFGLHCIDAVEVSAVPPQPKPERTREHEKNATVRL